MSEACAAGIYWALSPPSDENSAVCHDVKTALNRYEWENWRTLEPPCVNGAMSGVFNSDPPWRYLNIRTHEDLLFHLWVYAETHPNDYFNHKYRYPKSYYETEIRSFIAKGGRLAVWKTRLLNHNSRNALGPPLPPGQQVVVQLQHHALASDHQRSCPNQPYAEWWGPIVLVKPDLSGPIPEVNELTHEHFAYADGMKLLDRKPYLLSGGDVLGGFPNTVDYDCDFWKVKKP